MKKIKLIAGIFWAFTGLILIIILFPALTGLSVSFSKLPFMKLNPRYTGGEVVTRNVESACTLEIRKPVFNGFFTERKSGFVQIDWRGTLPEIINDSIDYDNDGRKDFYISIDRKGSKSNLVALKSNVRNVSISTPTSYGWAVRVNLVK
jgi:hypothetical protein